MSRPIIRPSGGGFDVTMWFYGRVWHLKCCGARLYWCIRANHGTIWVPLRHTSDFDTSGNCRMFLSQDNPLQAIEQAKFQIMRLRYRKPTPTFHEQYLHHFPTTP